MKSIIELNKDLIDLKVKKNKLTEEKSIKETEKKELQKDENLVNKSAEELAEVKNKLEAIVTFIENLETQETEVDSEIEKTEDDIEKYYDSVEKLKDFGKEVKELKPEKEKLLEITQSKEYMEVLGKSLATQNKSYVKEFLKGKGLSEKTITTATEGKGNGGILIPQYVADKIETQIKDVGNLLATLNKTNFKGDVEIPIEVAGIEALVHEEGTDKTESDPEFGTVSISVDFVYAKVIVTTKMEALDSGALATYLMDKLPEAVITKLEQSVVYGLKTDKIQGITTADDKFVKKIDEIASNDTILTAMETVRNATTVYMNRLTWVRNFMKLRDNEGRKLEEINYSIDAPAVWGLKVEYVDVMAVGEVIVGTGTNYTLNLPLGEGVAVDRSEADKHKNNKISYLPEVLVGGAITTLNGFAFISGIVTP